MCYTAKGTLKYKSYNMPETDCLSVVYRAIVTPLESVNRRICAPKVSYILGILIILPGIIRPTQDCCLA